MTDTINFSIPDRDDEGFLDPPHHPHSLMSRHLPTPRELIVHVSVSVGGSTEHVRIIFNREVRDDQS